MTVQFIEEDGQRKFAVLPIHDYQRIVEDLQMLDDVRAYDQAKERNEETLPLAVVSRILGGELAVRVIREHRGLNQRQLAHDARISEAYLSQIEAAKRQPSASVLKRLAAALAVDIDDLV